MDRRSTPGQGSHDIGWVKREAAEEREVPSKQALYAMETTPEHGYRNQSTPRRSFGTPSHRRTPGEEKGSGTPGMTPGLSSGRREPRGQEGRGEGSAEDTVDQLLTLLKRAEEALASLSHQGETSAGAKESGGRVSHRLRQVVVKVEQLQQALGAIVGSEPNEGPLPSGAAPEPHVALRSQHISRGHNGEANMSGKGNGPELGPSGQAPVFPGNILWPPLASAGEPIRDRARRLLACAFYPIDCKDPHTLAAELENELYQLVDDGSFSPGAQDKYLHHLRVLHECLAGSRAPQERMAVRSWLLRGEMSAKELWRIVREELEDVGPQLDVKVEVKTERSSPLASPPPPPQPLIKEDMEEDPS